ncbi:hypothetical protein CVT26_005800 [Gymnopilus dilepis]|uniref:Uncharacterized protein n=1 Tax=Gymnopilus dilepis TaxID=231916 RepID=A0A409YKZ5_9AGAR|nr:hypothetical protein CVT26_005800 [Gymnopilus dilepis]
MLSNDEVQITHVNGIPCNGNPQMPTPSGAPRVLDTAISNFSSLATSDPDIVCLGRQFPQQRSVVNGVLHSKTSLPLKAMETILEGRRIRYNIYYTEWLLELDNEVGEPGDLLVVKRASCVFWKKRKGDKKGVWKQAGLKTRVYHPDHDGLVLRARKYPEWQDADQDVTTDDTTDEEGLDDDAKKVKKKPKNDFARAARKFFRKYALGVGSESPITLE